MNGTAPTLLIYLAIINIVGFILFGLDKTKARQKAHRIPEKALLKMARFGKS